MNLSEKFKNIILAYNSRDVETFLELTKDISEFKKTIQKQILNMAKGIQNPLQPTKKSKREIPAEAFESMKKASRAMKRRFTSKRFNHNSDIIVDKVRFFEPENTDYIREFNFQVHATKGQRLRTKVVKKDQRDSGFTALILPDITEESDYKTLLNHTPPRRALQIPAKEYLKIR